MKRTIVRSALLLSLALALPACGGQTGIEVRIEPRQELVVGRDFNQIRVQVNDIDGEGHGETYPVTDLTETPYRVYVWAGERNKTAVRIWVKLLKDGAEVAERIEPQVTFTEGEIVPFVVTL